jgi:hypothetical protein
LLLGQTVQASVTQARVWLAAQPVDQSGIARVLIPPPDPFGLPVAQTQDGGGLHQTQFARFDSRHDYDTSPFLRTHS